jgi:hypothetical protein
VTAKDERLARKMTELEEGCDEMKLPQRLRSKVYAYYYHRFERWGPRELGTALRRYPSLHRASSRRSRGLSCSCLLLGAPVPALLVIMLMPALCNAQAKGF